MVEKKKIYKKGGTFDDRPTVLITLDCLRFMGCISAQIFEMVLIKPMGESGGGDGVGTSVDEYGNANIITPRL